MNIGPVVLIPMEYTVYFLKSKKDEKYYIGCTSKEPLERLEEHNKGMVKSTKHRRPFTLVHVEKFHDKNTAFKHEWYLKHPKGYLDKIQIIKEIERTGH